MFITPISRNNPITKLERAFNRLKHWRRTASQYDRRIIYFLSVLYLVSAVIWG